MSHFNSFIGGVKEGRAAIQHRQSAFNAAMMPTGKPEAPIGQATANRGRVQNVGAVYDDGGRDHVQLTASRGGAQDLVRSFAGLDPAKRIELKADLKRKSQIVRALSPLPPEQQVLGIQTYGKEFGFNEAALQRAAAHPAIALEEFSSSIQQAERMLEESRVDPRQNINQRNDWRYERPRDLGGAETPVTLVAQLAEEQDSPIDPDTRAKPRPQTPVNMGGSMRLDESKLLGPVDLMAGEENPIDRFLKEAANGVGDAAAAPPEVFLHKNRLRDKQPRAMFVQGAIESGISLARENPDLARELGIDTIKSNPGRFTGRVLGGSAISLAGSKGTKAALSKAGKSKKIQKAGGYATSAAIFSTSQYGAAIRAVNGLIDELEAGGADLSELSTGTIGRAAIAAAAGGNISYDAESGDITLLNPGVGDNVSGELILGNLKRRE